MRTQVAIVGAGPAGLLLAQLLHLEGIDSVVLEARNRDYIEGRIRAGVLEQGTIDVLAAAGVGERMRLDGMLHRGVEFAFDGALHRIDFAALTGRSICVYGQHEVVKDLVAARLATGRPLQFEAADVAVHDIASERPAVTFTNDGAAHRLDCDFIAGCDGFHGICRAAIPDAAMKTYEHTYPFGWLGILAAAPPASGELVYARDERGFALFSMRTTEITRLYLQCRPDENAESWSDNAIWDELLRRFEGAARWRPKVGPILQKSVTGMRSFLVDPMQYGRLYLAGDAAHIVPPTGAKGLNLAVADVCVLARALAERYRTGSAAWLQRYSATCLARVWRAQRFSSWMTGMLHRYEGDTAFAQGLKLAELRYVVSSLAASTSLAENYVGLPFEPDDTNALRRVAPPPPMTDESRIFARFA